MIIIQIIGAALLLTLIIAVFGAIAAAWFVTADRGPFPTLYSRRDYPAEDVWP